MGTETQFLYVSFEKCAEAVEHILLRVEREHYRDEGRRNRTITVREGPKDLTELIELSVRDPTSRYIVSSFKGGFQIFEVGYKASNALAWSLLLRLIAEGNEILAMLRY